MFRKNYAYNRWTVDTEENLAVVRVIYQRLADKAPNFTWQDVVSLLEKEPELIVINADVQQKKIHEGQYPALSQSRLMIFRCCLLSPAG